MKSEGSPHDPLRRRGACRRGGVLEGSQPRSERGLNNVFMVRGTKAKRGEEFLERGGGG